MRNTKNTQLIKQLVEQDNPANPLAYVRDIVRPLSLKKLNLYIKNCHDCASCSKQVKSLATGNPYAPVLIVQDIIRQEQIGSEEQVQPYNSSSSSSVDIFLTELLNVYHIDPNKLLWMNAIQCPLITTIDNEVIYRTAPTKEERDNCKLFIDFAIQAFAPMFIILLGNISLSMFIRDVTLDTMHGKLFSASGVPAIATFGPDYLQYLHANAEDTAELFLDMFNKDMDTIVKYMRDNHIPVFVQKRKENIQYVQ